MQKEHTTGPLPGARAAKIAIINAMAVIKAAEDLNELLLRATHSLDEPDRAAFNRGLVLSIDKLNEAHCELDAARHLEAFSHDG